MFALRRSTVLADARTNPIPMRPLALVRVGADPTKSWFTTDSNGKSWTFMDHKDSVPAGQRFEASTDEYPDSTYKFYEPTEEALIAEVEKVAKLETPSRASYSVGGGEEGEGGGKPGGEVTGSVTGDEVAGAGPTPSTKTPKKDEAPTGGGGGEAPATEAEIAGKTDGIVSKFSKLSTPSKVGVIALVLLVGGGVVWAVI